MDYLVYVDSLKVQQLNMRQSEHPSILVPSNQLMENKIKKVLRTIRVGTSPQVYMIKPPKN